MGSPIIQDGVYETLIDEELREALKSRPELRFIIDKVDFAEQPFRYAAFLSKLIEKALRLEPGAQTRISLTNRLIELLSDGTERACLAKHALVEDEKQLLLEVTPAHYAHHRMPRPVTPLSESSLFTGSPNDPQLIHELQKEMSSAERVDILVSFIKWSGLRLLMPALEELNLRKGKLRIITTSYMGASDPQAVEWLAKLPNAELRVSYDTERTRLHAKAYYFHRNSGFSTAYIGSANMSHAAMTSGLEWNLKVTAQDLPHILEKFVAEFATYWNSHEFVPLDPLNPTPLRQAIESARNKSTPTIVLFDLRPHAFQERILDALEAERSSRGNYRNLIVAATGTGKTVIAAFDFKRFYERSNRLARLLFVAHRREILEQAIATFRQVLRETTFGELLVGPYEASRMEHLFCSIDMLTNRQLWSQVGRPFYDFIIVDEVHHGPASSYRAIFDEFSPKVLLGLTATPERMDGQSVTADFGNRFAAEIRLPEALEEKLLCPFHYFGVADPVSLADNRFWRNGRYDVAVLDQVYTGLHQQAKQRLEAILCALTRYEPDLSRVRGIGFCVSVNHAQFMATQFNEHGVPSKSLVGSTDERERGQLLEDLRAGRLTFLFTCDVLNEGLDIPEINTVLFLRPTESLTVFLQQLGRGLRHAPGKDCLTVIDLVGQAHRRYRIDRKLKALLPRTRYSIESEVKFDFPHLAPGCSLQLDRLARTYVLDNIKQNLQRLSDQMKDRLESFENESGMLLTFTNFVRFHDYEPGRILKGSTWSEWKARARLASQPVDPDMNRLRAALLRTAQTTGPKELLRLRGVVRHLSSRNIDAALAVSGEQALSVHYRLWGKPGRTLGFSSVRDSFEKASQNVTILSDIEEILAWAEQESDVIPQESGIPFPSSLEIHANYSSLDIQAALGSATISSPGLQGVGVLHYPVHKAYALLITFQKSEREFSPSTMYMDYPISRELLHWESQSNTTQKSNTGQNLILHEDRRYSILLFARSAKKCGQHTMPYTFLGLGHRVSFESERPIRMTWRLEHPMPVTLFEENRRGG